MSAAFIHCELDDWDYDPRYTGGACPICRGGPPGAPSAPRWLTVSRRVPWDLVFLGGFFLVLLALALAVVQASGLLPPPHLPRSLPHATLSLPHLR